MFRKGAISIVALSLVLSITALPIRTAFASSGQIPKQRGYQVSNFAFPDVTLSGDTQSPKFVEIVYSVDAQCNLTETSRRTSDTVPDEVLQSSSSQGGGSSSVTASSQADAPVSILATTNTAHVKIYELDCCGIHTIELQTDQAWTWTSSTVSLSGSGLTTATWCCYWWHKTAGPSMSHGGNSSHVWANGSASYVCYNSQPVPFCIGSTPKYPMTFYTWLHMYPNGAASATGTSYSGTVIPAGSVVYQFWIT